MASARLSHGRARQARSSVLSVGGVSALEELQHRASLGGRAWRLCGAASTCQQCANRRGAWLPPSTRVPSRAGVLAEVGRLPLPCQVGVLSTEERRACEGRQRPSPHAYFSRRCTRRGRRRRRSTHGRCPPPGESMRRMAERCVEQHELTRIASPRCHRTRWTRLAPCRSLRCPRATLSRASPACAD
jgi:hypothetical protein